MKILKLLLTFWNYIRSIVCPCFYNVPHYNNQIFIISNGLRAPNEQDAYNYKDFKFTCKFGDGNHVVRKAKHKPTRKWMAIKTLPTQENCEEIRNLSLLNGCSCIVEFYGNIIIDRETHILMELMDFNLKDLNDYSHLIKENLEEELISYIAVKITIALDFCARSHIIHRDVKPANILLNWQGKIKLGDFGSSKFIELSLARSTLGTQLYWPPELYQMPNEPYDDLFDVWGLGLTLLECIYGNLNFISETREPIAFRRVVENIHDPSIWVQHVFDTSKYSDDLKEFILKCVASVNKRAHVVELRKTNLYINNAFKRDCTISKHLKKYQEPLEKHMKMLKMYKRLKKISIVVGIIAGLIFALILLSVLIDFLYEKYMKSNATNNTNKDRSTTPPIIPNNCYLKCPDGWTYSSNSMHCYKGFSISVTNSSIDDAEAICNQNNAHLISIHNNDENKFAANLFDPHGVEKDPLLGLTCDSENQYQWKDKTTVDFFNFQRNYSHPNNFDSYHCFWIDLATNMQYWEKSSCKNYTGVVSFVCKQSPRNIVIKTAAYEQFSSVKCPSKCTRCQGKCLDGWTYSYNTHQCYKMVYNASSFYDAEYGCKQFDAHLLSIHNDYENENIVKDVLLSSKISSIWIGISYDQDQNFTWSDTSQIDYNQWEDNEPDIKKGYCVYRNFRGKWQTRLCDDNLSFICKKNPFNMH